MIVRIDGIPIKTPSEFREERFNVTKGNRLADATMSLDLIAQKKKYYFTYRALTATEFKNITDQIDTNKLFFEVSIDLDGTEVVKTMYSGGIARTRHWSYANQEWVWKDITFNLIER